MKARRACRSRSGTARAGLDAPITVYHDLRVVLAASRRLDVASALAWWPTPAADAIRAVDEESLAQLCRREAGLDVPVSDLVASPGALWSMNHPSNLVLAEIARRVLIVMKCPAHIEAPEREYLAERCAPVEAAVTRALGWPQDASRPDWVVRGERVDLADVLAAQLEFYARRPDVVADTLQRYADRIDTALTAQPSASARRSAPVSSS